MKGFHLYLMAAAIALTGAGLSADTGISGSDSKMSGDHLLQVGSNLADEKITRDVQTTLAKVGDSGLKENQFDMLISHLAKADRERIGNFKNQKLDDLNRAITQFRADFKAKYHQDLDLRPEHFKDAMVYAGQDKNSATVSLSEAIFLGKSGAAMSTTVTTPGAVVDTTRIDTTTSVDQPKVIVDKERAAYNRSNAGGSGPGNPASDTGGGALGNRTTADSGVGQNSNTIVRGSEPMNTDTVVVQPGTVRKDTVVTKDTAIEPSRTGTISSGTVTAGATLTLNMINEGGLINAWKINIPDQITGEQLKGNLVKHIQMLDDQKATWPNDANAASRSAAFHVLQALNDSALATER